MRTYFATVFLALLVLPTGAPAATQTITATHTYMMGDNDSRNDARRMCFLEAKRKLLEKAGTFIESFTEVKSFQLTRDQVTSYAAAVLSVETVKENFSSNNGQNSVTMTVEAKVDTADVQKQLTAIVLDKELQGKIATQQQQLKQLEEQMRAVSAKLGATPSNNTTELRKERNVVLENIHELESKKLAAVQVIDDLTAKVKRYISLGMTIAEVRSILGSPRGSGHLYGEENASYNYGKHWINFEGGVVKCITEKQDYMCYSG